MQFKKIIIVFSFLTTATFAGTTNAACDPTHPADCSYTELLGMVNDTLLSVGPGRPVPAQFVPVGVQYAALGNVIVSAWFNEGIWVDQLTVSYTTVFNGNTVMNIRDQDVVNIRVSSDGVMQGSGSFKNGKATIKFPQKIFIPKGSSKVFQIFGDVMESGRGKVAELYIPSNSLSGIGEESNWHITSPANILRLGPGNAIFIQ
jgi:hypothetical protein